MEHGESITMRYVSIALSYHGDLLPPNSSFDDGHDFRKLAKPGRKGVERTNRARPGSRKQKGHGDRRQETGEIRGVDHGRSAEEVPRLPAVLLRCGGWWSPGCIRRHGWRSPIVCGNTRAFSISRILDDASPASRK